MVSSSTQKPFYLQPPWNILFELHKLQNIQPWSVNISFLLTSFLEEMEKQKDSDLRASGMALDSSATIYQMKTELLLILEEPPPIPMKSQIEFLPPPLIYPLRYELTSTTINHLLEALDKALTIENQSSFKNRSEPILPPLEIIPPIDRYLMEIDKKMKELYQILIQLANKGKLIIFSKIVTKLEKIEAIKMFIVLLFLAQKGKVDLWQEEEFGEIFITLIGETIVARKGAELI